MLERFLVTKKTPWRMNDLQFQTKVDLQASIENGDIALCTRSVCLCDSHDRQKIASIDRFGLDFSSYICKKCGLIFTNPYICDSSLPLYYNKFYHSLHFGTAEPKEDLFSKGQGSKIFNFMKAYLNSSNIKIFEMGAGCGTNLLEFANVAKKYSINVDCYGNEYNNDYVKYGNKKGLKLVSDSIEEYANKTKNRFDVIILSHVFEHLADPFITLNYLKKISHEDTILYIEVPGVLDLKTRYVYDCDFLKYLTHAHVFNFSLSSLNTILNQCGFELLQGDEKIESMFKVNRHTSNFITLEGGENDNYKEILSYLSELEADLAFYQSKNPANLAQNRLIGTLQRDWDTKGQIGMRSLLKKNTNSIEVDLSANHRRTFLPEEVISNSKTLLAQYKDKHRGQRCVIIGNGPSLNKMDLSFLKDEITFGLNRIYLMFDKYDFRPAYYVSVNPLVIEQSVEDILKIQAPKFLGLNGLPYIHDPGGIVFLKSLGGPSFIKDIRMRGGIWEGSTVTYVAMQLAYFMGFSEVILIGVDHYFTTKGSPHTEVISDGDDPNHFHPGYFGKGVRWNLPDLKSSEIAYSLAKQAFEADGRRIIDATFDGKLNIFSKENYKDLFEKYREIDQTKKGNLSETNFLNQQGEDLFSKGDFEEALNAFKRAIAIAPSFATAHNNLGVLYWQTGEVQKGVDHFARAVEIDPNDQDTILNCGELFNSLGKNEDARNIYSSYLRKNPNDEKVSELLKALDKDRRTHKDTLNDPANWPRISIVTPSFNQGRFLEECIDSILSQNYPNLEYIIMDGGSTDNSVDIIKKYEKYLTYWQSKPDGGQYAAVNGGFKKTTGEIMTWLNSDDKFHPNAFKIVASIFMHRKDVEWIMGRPNTFNEEGQPFWIEGFLPRWSREKYLKKEYKFIQQEGIFWRRSLWEKSGATLQTDLYLAGDLELWTHFFRYAQLHSIDIMTAGYRRHPGQKAQEFRSEYIREAEKILDREILLFKEGTNKELLPAPKPILISEIRKFVSKSDFEGALDVFAKGIKIIPNSASTTHNNLGVLYWQAGETQKAVEHFSRVFEINPDDRDTILNCGELFKSLEKIEDARNIYASYLQKNPNDEEVARALADLQDRRVIEVIDEDPEYLVSAIVSTYNSERFIRGCLEDLEAQTIADRLEIIVVNSGSEQNEEALVKEFQKKYSNIKYIRTDQRETVYAAWNRGVRASSGKYIANTNADDRRRADACERMVEVLEGRPDIALVYANVIITENENETFNKCTPAGDYRWLDWNRRHLLEKGCFMGPQPMWRRTLHDEYGYFDDTLVTSGDYEFWLRVSQTNNFLHIRDMLGLYLKSPDSIEHSNRKRQAAENERILSTYRKAAADGDIIHRFYSDNKIDLIRVHNRKGEELFQAGNVKAAQDIFEQILSREPQLVEPLNNLGVIAFQQGETNQAVSYFTRVMEIDKNYFEAIENLGKCAEAQKDYLKAAEWFEWALKPKPDDIGLLNSLGNCFIQTEDLLRAREVYEKSLGLDGGQENIEIILRELERMEEVKNKA